jgi:hypothetical protein
VRFWQGRRVSLEKPPPSRYRVEEKDGRLIVHDGHSGSTIGEQFSSAAPGDLPRSSPINVGRATSAAPPPLPSTSSDSGKLKRGATVAAIGIVLLLFVIFTGLWLIVVVPLLIAPIRQKLLDYGLPAIKRYIDEGRVS